jgi:hypothetical protein
LYDGYSYGAATTVQWAIKKLLILRTRIEKKETIEVEEGIHSILAVSISGSRNYFLIFMTR